MSLTQFIIPGIVVFIALIFGKPLLGFFYGIYFNISEFKKRGRKG